MSSDFYNSQSFMYQLTINDPIKKGYTHEQIKRILEYNFKTMRYYCMADEEGSMFHTHLFVMFNSRVRFSMIKRYFPEAHIEKCRGRVSDNVNYIKKSGKWKSDKSKQEKVIEGSFEESGDQPPDSRGKRADMSEFYQMIKAGMTNAEILATNQDYILQIEKIDKVRTTILTERFKEVERRDMEVIYISGATGTGKTRGVYESNGFSNVYRVTDYKYPFDGYACQPVIFFDEFRSSIELSIMLNYCDVYPMELPCRYTNRYACYNKVYIGSNIPLEKQYPKVQKEEEKTWKAFLRRINRVITYEEGGIITEYKTVIDYLNRDARKYTGEDL